MMRYAEAPTGEKDCPPLESVPASTSEVAALDQSEAAASSIELPWAQKGGFLNDASCLNRTQVYGVVQVKSVEGIGDAVRFAAEQGLKISLAGVRHSMGGQAFFHNALVLDIRQFNQMSLDEEQKILTVQSGAVWHDIQTFLHPKFAVKAMQSTDIFTVGGSISVNAHGMDHQVGAIGKTIRAMRLMLADGSIQTLSPTENAELFELVIGGYGLFGIILDVELEITENVVYASGRRLLDYQAFPELFESELAADTKLGLMYGHLSTDPNSLLREMILYTYEEQSDGNFEIPPLGEVSSIELRRFVLNVSKLGPLQKRLKWYAEKEIEPMLESCTVVPRSQALTDGEACLVSRNEPMHDSVKYLQNNLPDETDILQEYFIPRAQFIAFVDGLRQIVIEHEVNLLNASVRVVHQEANFLNYAPVDMFSVVLYINQATTSEGNEKMGVVTGKIIDLTTQLKGCFFLPYQLHYTAEQLLASNPQIPEFFAAKRRYDPDLRFTNTLYEKYAPTIAA
jgi:FAD/FMN-containing dehydrogenase